MLCGRIGSISADSFSPAAAVVVLPFLGAARWDLIWSHHGVVASCLPEPLGAELWK
jgi:hypothetical protein